MIFKLEYKNKDLDVARLEIITPGLVEKTIDGTEDPFRLIYKLDKSDKSGHFLTSSAEINIYETPEFNIDALKTSNETEIKVDYYINNIKKWTGFVIPDFFSKEIGKRSVVSMVASDRIGTLKGVTLTDLNAFVSLRTLAEKCLLKTGLSLPLKTMVDLEADAVNFFNTDALSQRLVDNKGRSISCYDILSSILVSSNSIILQRNAEWYIVNKLQHELGQGKLYSNSTTFTNWQDIIHNFSDVTVGARRTIIPVAASTGVYHEHGGGRLYPDNYDFSKGLTGWTSVNGFVASINDKLVEEFEQIGSYQDVQRTVEPVYKETTTNKYLVNLNYGINYAGANKPYLTSSNIPIVYPDANEVNITVDINATAPFINNLMGITTINAKVNFAIIASDGTNTLFLDSNGVFQTLTGDPYIHSIRFDGDKNMASVTSSKSIKGLLKVESGNLSDYNVTVRIYGHSGSVSGGGTGVVYRVASLINSVQVKISTLSDVPKGNIYKTEQGSNFTKEHEIETTVFGDYITSGLNGYFYNYPIDDTSSLYSNGVLTSKWTDITDPGVERSLLHHITTQRSRMFSQAHDLVSAEMDIKLFDPLSVYVACSKRYTLVSATVDFLRGRANLEIEEAVYQNLTKRDFIYSYFGDGESGIKSIGGISSGTGGGGSGGGMTADQVAILSEVQVLAHDHGNKDVLDQVTQEVVDNALREMIISTDTETELTDENYLSSLRVLKEILDNNEYLRTQFLSKVNPDTAQEIIKFVKGIEIGTFTTGPLGAGAAIKMENGVSRLEVDNLDVRMRATFRELIIESLKHIGGQLILSPARMKCTSVVDGGTYYRCYFDTGDGKVSNEFVAGDQARCQVFTGSGVKMYWRLVTSVGTDWINLSKTDAISGSSIPEAGDDIVQLGNRSDATRQNAQILSTVGVDAPSWKQYKGINSFSLEGKDTTVFSGTGNKIDGKTVFVSSGSNLDDWATGTSQDVQDAQAAANAAALAAQQAIDDAAANVTDYNAKFATVQAQLDGEVSNWFYPYSPTLANYPASDWTTNTIKDRHIGDTFTNTQQAPATDAGKSWRFVKNGTVYSWTQIADSDAVLALQKAAEAKATADGKSTTYLIQPTSYHLGDTWMLDADRTVNGVAYKSGEILTATQDSSTFVEAHWVKRVRYTDDTAVNNLQLGTRNYYHSNSALTFYGNNSGFFVRPFADTPNGFWVRGKGSDEAADGTLRVSDVIKDNGQYTIKFRGKANSNGVEVIVGVNQGNYQNIVLNSEFQDYEFTVNVTNWSTVFNFVDFVFKRFASHFIVDFIVVKGNKAPASWIEADEDVQARLDAEKTRIDEILSDNIADPSEKQYLSNLWQEIYAEYPRIWAQADTYAVDKSNYEAKYSALNTLLSPVLANLTTNSTVSGASIRTAFSQYYDARTFLLNNITNKVNQNAGDAATVAADAQAKANISKAVTDKFSGFDGGLATAVIMEMREPSTTTRGDATAGISGIQKDINGNFLPAVWTGGTYAQAVAGTAKSIDKHDGSGHRAGGKLSWDAAGNLTVEGTVNATDGEFTGMVKGNAGYFEGLVRNPFVETTNQTTWWGDESGFHPIITNPATASTNIIARNIPGAGMTSVKLPTVINGYRIAVFNGETANNGGVNSFGKIEISAGTKQILNANYGFTTDIVDQYNDQPGTISVLTGRSNPISANSMIIDFGEYVELVGVGTIGWIVTNRLKAR